MNQANKESIVKFAKVLALFVLGMLTIITCCGLWSATDVKPLVKWVGGFLFAGNACTIILLWKKAINKTK